MIILLHLLHHTCMHAMQPLSDFLVSLLISILVFLSVAFLSILSYPTTSLLHILICILFFLFALAFGFWWIIIS